MTQLIQDPALDVVAQAAFERLKRVHAALLDGNQPVIDPIIPVKASPEW